MSPATRRTGDRDPIMAGRLLAGRYRLGSLIGAGDLGMVWRATDEVAHRTVAVKHLSGDDAGDRVRREALVAQRVEHPRLLRVLDVLSDAEQDDGWLVMQYVRARTWASLWLEHGRVAVPAAAHVAAQVADALTALHRAGVAHGDVTPDNVLVDADGEVKLVDLGAARLLAEADDDPGSQMTGRRDYRAPEVRAGSPPGAAADVYALGAATFEAVNGRGPWTRDCAFPRSLHPLLAADPARRPDAHRAAALLAAIASGPA